MEKSGGASHEPPDSATAAEARRRMHEQFFARADKSNLKGESVRGGAVTMISQALKFVMQTAALIIVARLIRREDNGLQTMVVTITGVVSLFKDAGLGMATVQRDVITHEQVSTLFWINVAIGFVLALIVVAAAPILVIFYNEPRLFWMTMVSASVFLIGGAGLQHQALLQRTLRFVTLAKIEVAALAVTAAVGVGMAMAGYGYWALVAMSLCGPVVGVMGAWIAVPWRPGLPSRKVEVRSMLRFGGTVTLNNFLVYLAYNVDKILVGRFCGVEAVGLYSRAFQLIIMPLQQMHYAVFSVVFPTLARLQDNPQRLNAFFLKAFSVVLGMIVPVVVCCALFAEEMVFPLGKQWAESAAIFRLLAPMILVLGIINPLGWFLYSTGRTTRSMKMALVLVPVVILGVVAGLAYGSKGVAAGYSIAMLLLTAPWIAWTIHGTGIKGADIWKTIWKPVAAGLLAGLVALPLKLGLDSKLHDISMLLLGTGLVFAAYAFVLLIVMGQKAMYLDLLKEVLNKRRVAVAPQSAVA